MTFVKNKKYVFLNKNGVKTELMFISKTKKGYNFKNLNGAKVLMSEIDIKNLIW